MCAQRQQTPVHRSCERALRVPCRRHSPLHISGFRHWQMGKGSSVPFTNHARRVLSSQQPTAHARMLERTPVIVFAPLRRACARAIACGGGVVAFVTSRLRCAPGPPPLLRAPPAANAESPPCRIVGCVFGCVLVSHYGEVAVEIR